MAMNWPAGVIGNKQSQIPLGLGSIQESPLTGSSQLSGSSVVKWRFVWEFPPQDDQALIGQVNSLIARARQERIIMPVFQPRVSVAGSGAVTIGSGASAWSKNLALAGIGSGYGFKAGQFISVSTGGRWYLYALQSDSAPGAANRQVVATSTWRALHQAGDAVEIIEPKMEGWLDPTQIDYDVASLAGFSIGVTEA